MWFRGNVTRRPPASDSTLEDSDISIDHAIIADLDDAAGTLAAAFDAYPWTRWSIPEDGYRERLHRLQRMYLGYAFDHGVVLVTTDRCGVIALLPPDVPEPDGQFQAEAVALHGDRLAAVARAETPAHPVGAWNLRHSESTRTARARGWEARWSAPDSPRSTTGVLLRVRASRSRLPTIAM